MNYLILQGYNLNFFLYTVFGWQEIEAREVLKRERGRRCPTFPIWKLLYPHFGPKNYSETSFFYCLPLMLFKFTVFTLQFSTVLQMHIVLFFCL